MNVFQLPAIYTSPDDPLVYSTSRAAFIKDLRSIQEKTLAKAIDEAKRLKPGLEFAAELKEGEPAAQIVEAAQEGGFDVIVVGHRGLGRLSEVFLGGVSERVAKSSRSPPTTRVHLLRFVAGVLCHFSMIKTAIWK